MSRPRSRSAASAARITIKNRRKRYLDTHPTYLTSAALELADPLAYDRLVRRFQTSTEREAEGRQKGYSGVLEADLWRSEAKVKALADPEKTAATRYTRNERGEIIAEEKDEVPSSKEEALQIWRQAMELRFLSGEDIEFDYDTVDTNEGYDDLSILENEEQDKYFENEEPRWTTLEDGDDRGSAGKLCGQTGIQDF